MSKSESSIVMGFIGSVMGSSIVYCIFDDLKIACISLVCSMIFVILGSLFSR